MYNNWPRPNPGLAGKKKEEEAKKANMKEKLLEKLNDVIEKSSGNIKAFLEQRRRDIRANRIDWSTFVIPVIDDPGDPFDDIVMPVDIVDEDDNIAPFDTRERIESVTSLYPSYPYQCSDDKLIRGQSCAAEQVPLAIWPMAHGPESTFLGKRSWHTQGFDACCSPQSTAKEMLGGSTHGELNSMFKTAQQDSDKLIGEITNTIQTCFSMWRNHERSIDRLSNKRHEKLERALANVIQMGAIVSADLRTVRQTSSYREAVVLGTSTIMRGAMPRLPNSKERTGSLLDYMRAEFYHHVGKYFRNLSYELGGIDVVQDAENAAMSRDRGWGVGIDFITRGLNAVVYHLWNIVENVSFINMLMIAFGIAFSIYLPGTGLLSAIRAIFSTGPSTGSNGASISGENKAPGQAALLSLVTMAMYEMIIDDQDAIRVAGQALQDVMAASEQALGTTLNMKSAAADAAGTAGLGVAMAAGMPGIGTGLAGGFALYSGLTQYGQTQMASGAGLFVSALNAGLKLYPSFNRMGPLFLMVHNIIWWFAMSSGAELMISGYKLATDGMGSITASLSKFADLFLEKVGMSSPEQIGTGPASIFQKAMEKLQSDGILASMGIGQDQINVVLENGPIIAVFIMAVLALLGKFGSGIDLDTQAKNVLRDVTKWKNQRVSTFFKENQSFLPRVNNTVFYDFCKAQPESSNEDCRERYKKIMENRLEISSGCEHFHEVYQKKGYTVCGDL